MAYSFLSLLIIVFSAVTGLIAEGLCWFFVYRTSAYKRLEMEVERATKRVNEASGSHTGGKSKKLKQEQRKEDLMKASAGEIFKFQLKTAFIMGLTLLLFYNVLSQFFDGMPVAKLPFNPPGFIRRASHRNLIGEDYTDCSMAFIYMLCATSVRNNLGNLLGLGPSKYLRQKRMFDPANNQLSKPHAS